MKTTHPLQLVKTNGSYSSVLNRELYVKVPKVLKGEILECLENVDITKDEVHEEDNSQDE